MDAQELQEIRDLLGVSVVMLGTGEEVEGAVSEEIARALLDYIDALKADMAGIRKRAHELTAIPHPEIMRMAAEIYNLAAQHADEPENGA